MQKNRGNTAALLRVREQHLRRNNSPTEVSITTADAREEHDNAAPDQAGLRRLAYRLATYRSGISHLPITQVRLPFPSLHLPKVAGALPFSVGVVELDSFSEPGGELFFGDFTGSYGEHGLFGVVDIGRVGFPTSSVEIDKYGERCPCRSFVAVG